MTFSIRAIIEVLGFPEEHVKEVTSKILEHLKQETNISVKTEYIAELIQKEKLWSTFLELELEIKDFIHLNYFCFNYTPSSIEVLDTKDITLNSRELTAALNDSLHRLHTFNITLSKLFAENKLLKEKSTPSV